MRLDLKNPANRQQIESVRSQISNSNDLRKFDDFISENTTFDFDNAEDLAAARRCCGGDNCCQNITIEVRLSAL